MFKLRLEKNNQESFLGEEIHMCMHTCVCVYVCVCVKNWGQEVEVGEQNARMAAKLSESFSVWETTLKEYITEVRNSRRVFLGEC